SGPAPDQLEADARGAVCAGLRARIARLPSTITDLFSASGNRNAMANLDTLISDLVIANRILAKEDVVDAYGHVSVRHPSKPDHYLLSRSLSPEFVTRE